MGRWASLQCQHLRNIFSWSQGLGNSQLSSTALDPPRHYVCIWFTCLNLQQENISEDLQVQPSPEKRLIRRHFTQALQSLKFLDPTVPDLWRGKKKKNPQRYLEPLSIAQTQPWIWPGFATICMDIIVFFSLMLAEHLFSHSLRNLTFSINLHW